MLLIISLSPSPQEMATSPSSPLSNKKTPSSEHDHTPSSPNGKAAGAETGERDATPQSRHHTPHGATREGEGSEGSGEADGQLQENYAWVKVCTIWNMCKAVLLTMQVSIQGSTKQ